MDTQNCEARTIEKEIECAPIKSLAELYEVQSNLPKWISQIIELVPRSHSAIPNSDLQCHHLDANGLIRPRIDKDLIPRTLVCHDMKNGYLEDRFLESRNIGNGYTFYQWQNIDIFIYFSHHFITIPPMHWINLAHKNGVQILGTLITEWSQGEIITKEFLRDEGTIRNFVASLVELSCAYRLDGWLINIENDVQKPKLLIEFLKVLTKEMHLKRHRSIVLWYDSVIDTGTLQWQNELNKSNKCFFDICDGIFLNYSWTDKNLVKTAAMAKHRSFDVYVGIDVFGRNTPYPPGPYCYKGIQKAREQNFSIALFAPAWTHESIEIEPEDTFFARYLENDKAFWFSVWPYLYTHPVTHPFETNFYVGADKRCYKLADQQVQLSQVAHNKIVSENTDMQTRCACIQMCHMPDIHQCYYLIIQNPETMTHRTFHHLIATSFELKGHYCLYLYTRKENEKGSDFFDLVLVMLEGGHMRKIICHSKNNYAPEFAADRDHVHFVTASACDQNVVIDDAVSSDSTLRCCTLNFGTLSRLLHIYGTLPDGGTVVLSGFGIKKIN